MHKNPSNRQDGKGTTLKITLIPCEGGRRIGRYSSTSGVADGDALSAETETARLQRYLKKLPAPIAMHAFTRRHATQGKCHFFYY